MNEEKSGIRVVQRMLGNFLISITLCLSGHCMNRIRTLDVVEHGGMKGNGYQEIVATSLQPNANCYSMPRYMVSVTYEWNEKRKPSE